MFLSKEALEATVEKYGINVDGLNWPQKQGKVSKYLTEHQVEAVVPGVKQEQKPKTLSEALKEDFTLVTKESSKSPVSASPVAPQPSVPVLCTGVAKRVQLDARPTEPTIESLGLKGKIIVFSPEIAPNPNRYIKYREDLGEDMDVEEVWYNGEDLDRRHVQGPAGSPVGISGTYKVKTIPNSKVEAISGLPQQNVAIYWPIDTEPFPIAEFQGRRGYLWSHATIPCMKPVIVESGYYQDFKDQLQDEPNIFYLGGGIRAIDMNFARYMMDAIEEREEHKHGKHIR